MMNILSIIPVEMKAMSIITLILIVAIVFMFAQIYKQIRVDLKEHKEQELLNISYVKDNHNVLKKDFEDTRENLFNKINEVKDDFGDVKITVGITQEMIKSNADIQKIIQNDITEIRKRLNR